MRVIAVVLCAAVALAGCSSGSAAPPAAHQAETGGHTASSSPAADRASIGRPTSSATGSGSRMADWLRLINPKLQRVERTITSGQTAVRRPDHHGLTAACRQLLTDVHDVQVARPAPDRAVRASLTQTTDAFVLAAHQCLAGRLESAGRSVNKGHRYEEALLTRIRVLVPAAQGSI